MRQSGASLRPGFVAFLVSILELHRSRQYLAIPAEIKERLSRTHSCRRMIVKQNLMGKRGKARWNGRIKRQKMLRFPKRAFPE